MQVKVLGAERRRRWSYDEKVRLVEETLQAGETVYGVARRHGLAESLIHLASAGAPAPSGRRDRHDHWLRNALPLRDYKA